MNREDVVERKFLTSQRINRNYDILNPLVDANNGFIQGKENSQSMGRIPDSGQSYRINASVLSRNHGSTINEACSVASENHVSPIMNIEMNLWEKPIMIPQVEFLPAKRSPDRSVDRQSEKASVYEESNQEEGFEKRRTKSSVLFNDTLCCLDLSGKAMNTFEYNLKSYEEILLDINLSKNRLVQFPQELFRLKCLKFLHMDYNYIQYLPRQFSLITTLEFCSISNNRIEELPENFNLLMNLKCLNIGKNMIKKLGKETTGLSSLETLFIYGNMFGTLPVQLYKLANLKELGLGWLKYTDPPYKEIEQKAQNPELFDNMFSLFESYDKMNILDISFSNFVQNISEKPIDFSKVNILNRTMMHRAARDDEPGILLDLLIEYPFLSNICDKEGQSPLTLALLEGNKRFSRVLLLQECPSKTLNVNIGGGNHGSAIHLAINRLDDELIELLFRHKADGNCTDNDFNTPLHILFTIFSRNVEKAIKIGEMLIENGSLPNRLNKDLWSPLHLAVKRSQLEALSWALETNRKHEMRTGVKGLFNFNRRGGAAKLTPFHLAANIGNKEIIELLSQAESNVFVENIQGKIPRDMACHSLLTMKLVRKTEREWLQRNIISTTSLRRIRSSFNEGNVQCLKMKIEKMMNKRDLKMSCSLLSENPLPPKEISLKPGIVLVSRKLNEKVEEDEDYIEDPELASPYEAKLVSSDILLEDIEEFTHGRYNTHHQVFSRNMSYFGEGIETRQIKKKKISTNHLARENESDNSDANFLQNRKLLMSLNSLEIEKFMPEMERVETLLIKAYTCLSERIRCLWYLRALHCKLSDIFYSFNSQSLPVSLYILNFLKISNYPDGAESLVPEHMIRIQDNLLMKLQALKSSPVSLRLSHQNESIKPVNKNESGENLILFENDENEYNDEMVCQSDNKRFDEISNNDLQAEPSLSGDYSPPEGTFPFDKFFIFAETFKFFIDFWSHDANRIISKVIREQREHLDKHTLYEAYQAKRFVIKINPGGKKNKKQLWGSIIRKQHVRRNHSADIAPSRGSSDHIKSFVDGPGLKIPPSHAKTASHSAFPQRKVIHGPSFRQEAANGLNKNCHTIADIPCEELNDDLSRNLQTEPDPGRNPFILRSSSFEEREYETREREKNPENNVLLNRNRPFHRHSNSLKYSSDLISNGGNGSTGGQTEEETPFSILNKLKNDNIRMKLKVSPFASNKVDWLRKYAPTEFDSTVMNEEQDSQRVKFMEQQSRMILGGKMFASPFKKASRKNL